MSNSRYSNTEEVENYDIGYKKAFKSRFGLSDFILQKRRTGLKYPDHEDLSAMNFQFETWKVGSRLHKIAEKYYGNPTYWWVIGLYNKKPVDADYSLGDVVKVPMPLEEAIANLGL
jgi:hypothetical protein|tara:strand:+ start:240 stop:587 length:348 start_codon:yes stop_codon:yes gene_type:complete